MSVLPSEHIQPEKLSSGGECVVHSEPLLERLNRTREKIVLYCPSCEAERSIKTERRGFWRRRLVRTVTFPLWFPLFLLLSALLGGFGLLGIPVAFVIKVFTWFTGTWDVEFQSLMMMIGIPAGVVFSIIGTINLWRDRERMPTLTRLRYSILDDAKKYEPSVMEFLNRKYREFIQLTSGIEDLDGMTGVEFEDFVASFISRMGDDVFKTRASGDMGVDLVVEWGNHRRTAVQCKRYAKNTKIGPGAVQEVYTGKDLYECNGALIITTASGLTKQAREMAEKLNVEIWDRRRLAAILAEGQPKFSWEMFRSQFYEYPEAVDPLRHRD